MVTFPRADSLLLPDPKQSKATGALARSFAPLQENGGIKWAEETPRARHETELYSIQRGCMSSVHIFSEEPRRQYQKYNSHAK